MLWGIPPLPKFQFLSDPGGDQRPLIDFIKNRHFGKGGFPLPVKETQGFVLIGQQ